MKNIIDTNPIITACISDDYKEKIIKYIQDQDSLMILTIYNEIEDKLLKFHMALIGLEKFSVKGNKSLLLNLPVFKDLKEASGEIYNFIKDYKGDITQLSRRIQLSVGILLAKLKNLRIYPNDDKEKQEIINSQKNILSKELPKIKENDLNHLYLMYDYTQKFASKINFYTEDKIDYLNNKEEIESILRDIMILDFSKYE